MPDEGAAAPVPVMAAEAEASPRGSSSGLSDVWMAHSAPESLRLTYELLQAPHRRVSRVLEVVSDEGGALNRRLTYEYDSPGIAHFFPALIVPLGRLIDTIHIESEDRVQQVTLTKTESMVLSYLLLQAEVASLRPSAHGTPPGYVSGPTTGIDTDVDVDNFLLPLVPEIARQTREDVAGLYAALRRLRLLAQTDGIEVADTLSRTAAYVTDNSTWRLLRTFMTSRVVYVPVGASTDSGQAPRSVRQKITITYEHDSSVALASSRSRYRALLGHQVDDYIIHAHGIGRSRSYHFRMRGRNDHFVRKVDVLTPHVDYFIDDWERPRIRELGPVQESSFDRVEKPKHVVDNLVHVHVTGDRVPVGFLGDARRYYIRARFQERPAGNLGVTMIRLMVALAIAVGLGIAAPELVDSPRTATVPLSVFFAVPSLIGLTQGFRASSYVVCNVATYGTVVLSILCGMLYVRWAVARNMPDSWIGSRAIYVAAVTSMAVWLIWVMALLGRGFVAFYRRKRAA